MGVFDRLKNRKSREEKVAATEQAAQPSSPQTKPQSSAGIRVNGEVLKKVYPWGVSSYFAIPENIKSIDMWAFANLHKLRTVYIHDDVKYISPHSFQFCDNLTEVIGLENAISIKYIQGFDGCTSLANITLPPNVRLIGDNAFAQCKSLKKINIPSGCQCISRYAFEDCESLQMVKIPSSVELIDYGAFKGCKNLTVVLLNDNKTLFDDLINHNTSQHIIPGLPSSQHKLSDEQMVEILDAFNVKHTKIDIEGKEFVWLPSRISIKPLAFDGVKQVVVCNKQTFQAVMDSGYTGKITFVNKAKQTAITFNLGVLGKEKQTYNQNTDLGI